MVELVVRLVFSLAVVLGMVMVLARLTSKRFRGAGGSLVRLVHRQALSRGTAVAVVTVGSRVLVLGTTEQEVRLLTELDPEELDLDLGAELEPASDADSPAVLAGAPAASLEPAVRPALPAALARSRARSAGRHARVADSALAGSVLSAETWRQALAAATRKTQDAS